LANEERIQIILLLHQNGEMFAQDIERNFFLEQSTTSHHLNTLKQVGIAKTRKEGRRIYYSLNMPEFGDKLLAFNTLFDSEIK
jgi:DNA-binding transcriptional ArsR family regulator